ncbi:MAG TPA: hypothetical protein VJB13_02715 [Candidatus Nanoarchaeia archaeon]|nr:hypothetical protein [Candidatus Nanoarchaeia archaeon]
MYKKRWKVDRSSFISSSKGQVTIFIILGILLVLVITLVIFVRKEIITFNPQEIIPTEKGKVENFITTCMDKVGNDALVRVGLQGGYIELPFDVVNDNNRRLEISPSLAVPYWAYGPETNIPSLSQIKEQIDDYMEKNVRDCLFSMEAFQESYDLVEKSELTSDTEIVPSKVIFNLHWDVEIRNKGGEVITEVIDHTAESPVKLQTLHTVARSIVEKEMETLKLEDITQDLIALEHPDVPVAGMELSCNKKRWEVESVKNTMLDLVRVNIQELKVQGTDYLQFPEDLTYYQNHYVWDLGEDFRYPQVSALFNFDQTYPYTFAVTPLVGNKMQSSQLGGSNLLSFLCIQTWKFTYDFVYPVLVKVKDETTGYTFQIAFTVHVIRNNPDRGEPVPRPSYFVNTVSDEEYCASKDVPMTVFAFEKVENEETGAYNREPLDKVNTSFTCLRYKCEMLPTEYDFAGRGNVAGYTSNFPYCAGGILRGTKDGYKESWQRVVTAPGKEVNLDLIPVYELPASKITIVKHAFTDPEHIGPGTPLKKGELGLVKISFKKKADLPNTAFHESTITKSVSNDQEAVEALEKLELLAKADFTYELEVNVLGNEKFVGGYKGSWSVPWNELKDAKEIVFHVVSKESASQEEMFDLLVNEAQYSKYVSAPEIKS